MTDHIEKTITFSNDEVLNRLSLSYDSQNDGDIDVAATNEDGTEAGVTITFNEAIKLLEFLIDVLGEEADRREGRALINWTVPLLSVAAG